MQTILFPVSAAAFPLQDGVRELLESALDQGLLIANTRGEILFATRKTRVILQAFFAEMSDDLIPNEIRTWLTKGDTSEPLVIRHSEKGEIEIHNFPLSPSGSLSLMRIEPLAEPHRVLPPATLGHHPSRRPEGADRPRWHKQTVPVNTGALWKLYNRNWISAPLLVVTHPATLKSFRTGTTSLFP